MATVDEYAAWIVKNADKKGTPEFDTVAAAYKDAKSQTMMGRVAQGAQDAATYQPPVQPAGPIPAGPIPIGKEGFPAALRETLAGTDWATRNIAGAGTAPALAWEGLKGLVGKTNPEQVQNQRIISQSAPVGSLAGNVAMLAPTAMIPGVNTVVGAGLVGTTTGALLTPGDLVERSKASILGGLGGMGGAGLSSAISRKLPSALDPNVLLLSKEGIQLTPGQNAGGSLKSFEDKATSIPILGNIINNARKGGIEDFNRAAIARATLPGMQVSGVGNQAIQDIRQGLGQSYDSILSKSSANALDPQYVANMSNLRSLVASLPSREAKSFDSILSREVGDRMAPNGMINAENLQAVKSGLGEQIKNFSGSNDAYQRQLGQALKQANAEFRDLVSRSNPQNAKDLQAVDLAYANFKRLQRASSGVGAEEGVFTPAQLHNAVKAMDKTKDKRAFSEGDALLQDLTSAGKAVMPSKIPDSGTAGRMMNNLFSLGGLTSTAGGLAAAMPAYLAYSRPGSAAINALINSRVPVSNLLQSSIQNNPNALRLLGTSYPEFMSNEPL
jgi:hypothetical protein